MTASKIEWTEHTWNPIVGCSIVSPGCTNCYAMRMAGRLELMGQQRYAGTTRKVNGNTVWTGKLARAPNPAWFAPIERKKPTMYFVNSMSDLFHEDCPDDWILDALTVMAIASQHTFQVLTKRPDRMREFMSRPDLLEDIYTNWYSWSGGAREVWSWPLHNLWLGTSAEDQPRYDARSRDLYATPAKVRFFSMEPLIGPIKADWLADWVITGGESGHNARPMNPQWAQDIRDQCAAAGVAYFHKQNGEFRPCTDVELKTACGAIRVGDRAGHTGEYVMRVGKAKAGALLDGREHKAFPETCA